MTVQLRERGIRAVLLDIEGTTTPMSFVREVLFPFARAHLDDYLREARGSPDLREAVTRLVAEYRADAARGGDVPNWPDAGPETATSCAAYVLWLMDQDRKSPGLKLLQGHIWERGYRAGLLKGQVFPDVPPAIRRWRDSGLELSVYSSGSVLAQRLLFESTGDADLTPYLNAFFDTAVGPKISADSYRRIAQALRHPPAKILFISDVVAELRAAREAAFQILLSVRPGNAPQPQAGEFESVQSFDEIQ